MSIKKSLIYASAMVLLSVGCNNAKYVADTDALLQGNFSAQVEELGTQTRTSLGENRMVVWSEEDQIAIFQGSSLADKYQVMETSVGNSNGEFFYVSNVEEENGNFYAGNEVVLETNVALYPYQKDLSCLPVYNGLELESFSISNITIPATQTYAENSFPMGSFPMVAVTEGENDHNLKFKNVFGILKLQLKGNRKVVSISISGKGEEILAGEATITAYPDGSVPIVTLDKNGETTVTLDCGEGVELNQRGTIFMIALPPIAFNNGFDIAITDSEDKIETLSTSKSNPIERSTILAMPVVNLDPDGKTDLSHASSANCYIVSKAGTYKFKTVKGNSNTSVGAVSNADVLWESFGTDVAPIVGDLISEASYNDGYITFATNPMFKEGNAVIAAKDVNGNILWSWHIWLTDQPEEQEYFNNAGTVMDRHLGATSATPGDIETFGLLYQWGRKDPFLGSSSKSEGVIALSTLQEWPFKNADDLIDGSLQFSIANPTTFIGGRGDWRSGDDIIYWTSSESPKAIYDPCPPEWRIPDGYYIEYGLWGKAAGNSRNINGVPDNDNMGVNFGSILGSSSIIWYPICGMRGYGSGNMIYSSEYGDVWSVTPQGPSYLEVYKTGASSITTKTTSPAKAIRCVRE